MGRLESLAAWALGRGHYEEEIIRDTDASESSNTQQYNSRGYPRNPLTKKKERDNVRAANEVMQTTGVVEDGEVAKEKFLKARQEKEQELLTALRLMEAGRAVLVGGVWGVLGLRRRILLYRPFSKTTLLGVIRHEVYTKSMPSLIWSGLPTVAAYHASDWIAFLTDTVLTTVIDEDEGPVSLKLHYLKLGLQALIDVSFCSITLHFRLFAILQQLNLIPPSRLLPSARSFIPFSATSPLKFPPLPGSSWQSIVGFGTALFWTAAPMLAILVHGKFKYFISRLVYEPIYKCLPRPMGESMFAGSSITAPTMEYDTPDHPPSEEEIVFKVEDGPTLRALEGSPDPSSSTFRPPPNREIEQIALSEDDEEDQTPTTLISFDVEATEPIGTTQGSWSAELRSAQEPVTTSGTKYRTTGLTMLPVIMATEGLRKIAAGIVVMPLEALMVRIIGRAYRASAGLTLDDMYDMSTTLSVRTNTFGLQGWENLFVVFAAQLAVTGVVWAGFVGLVHWYTRHKFGAKKENSAKGLAQ